jgi:hypothetical protein
LAEDAGTVQREVFLERGRTLTVHIQDPLGKPLTSVQVGGLTDDDWSTFLLTEASCTVYALRANTPRALAFVHPERRLAGLLTLRGDEKEAYAVSLSPTGAMVGRVLDSEGRPLAGVLVRTHIMDNKAALALEFQMRLRRQSIRTGADGSFRINNVIPEVKQVFILNKGKTNLAIYSPIGQPKVESGKTLDLGDLRTKPGG